MRQHGLTLLFLMLCTLAACTRDIEFNGEETDPVLVVNCLPGTDSIITAKITASRFFLSSQDTFTVVNNATAALYVDGIFAENLTLTGKGVYRSSVTVGEGHSMHLVVSAPGYETVEAEETFCPKINLIKVDTTVTRTNVQPIEFSDGFRCTLQYTFRLTFSDPVGENFYRLVVKRKYENSDWESYLTDYDDVVFGAEGDGTNDPFGNEDSNNKYGIFTDELFDGKEYTLTYRYDREYYDYGSFPEYNSPSETITFDLQAISKGYFRYISSRAAISSEDDLFSEPVQVYSNMEGGIGILGTCTHCIRKVFLP